MIASILYVFLVHIIVCTAADDSVRHQLSNASNQARASPLKENIDTYQHNTSKECLVIINKTDLTFLQQLAQNKVVHVIELDVQFPFDMSNSMIEVRRWYLTNNIGRQILSVLALDDRLVTWTLDVGRETAKISLVYEPPGCTIIEKEPADLIAGAILKPLSFVDEKEMCFDKVSSKSTLTRCCKIIGKDLLKCDGSVAGFEFVEILEPMLSEFKYCFAFGMLVIIHFGIILQWSNTNITMQKRDYYQLTECPMSLSSILCMLFWDGYGRFISYVRRCLLIIVVGLVLGQFKLFSDVANIVIFAFWAILYFFSRLFDFEEAVRHKYIPDRFRSCYFRRLFLERFSYFCYDIHDVYRSARVNVLGGISLITLPFNVKRWKNSLVKFYTKPMEPAEMGTIELLYKIFGVLLIFIMQVIFVFYVALESFFFVLLRRVSIIVFHAKRRNYRISHILDDYNLICIVLAVCEIVCMFCTISIFFQVFLFFTSYIVIPLVCGLILNVVFFFPYIVYISILTCYSWMFWTSVEQQYAVLMTLIFHQNMENNSNSDSRDSVGTARGNPENMDDTDHVGSDSETREKNSVADIDDHVTEVVCVVSKKLYDKIREQLLPYDGILFWFVLKVFLISIFFYLTLTLVRMQPSSTVQALVTFSVSALPYIMNVVAAKKSEEEKDVWKEQLRNRVKSLVDEFTADSLEMSPTKLIIVHRVFYSTAEDAEFLRL